MLLDKLAFGVTASALLVACGGSSTGGSEAASAAASMEKCYGIVNASMNDCAANGHACAGQASRDADPNEWLTVPKGTCSRIAGGVVRQDKSKS